MLKFKNNYIVNQDDKEIAELSVKEHVPVSEKYVVYLKNVVDYMSADTIRQYIDAAEKLNAETIVQAGMKNSLVEQLKQKLHDCLMETNLQYRYEFETNYYKKEIETLQQLLAEERGKRWELENEIHELKMSLKKSEVETENEN